jgi:hypothetical protein
MPPDVLRQKLGCASLDTITNVCDDRRSSADEGDAEILGPKRTVVSNFEYGPAPGSNVSLKQCCGPEEGAANYAANLTASGRVKFNMAFLEEIWLVQIK